MASHRVSHRREAPAIYYSITMKRDISRIASPHGGKFTLRPKARCKNSFAAKSSKHENHETIIHHLQVARFNPAAFIVATENIPNQPEHETTRANSINK